MRTRRARHYGVLLWLAAVVCSAGAQVEVLPSAGSAEGHGWLVVPQDFGRNALLHLPPRAKATSTLDDTGPSGSVRRVMNLAQRPVAMAATGRRVVMLFAATPGDGAQRWPVRSIGASPAGQGTFRYEPKSTGGGLRVEPSLRAAGALIAAASAGGAIYVLTGPIEDGGAGQVLWRLGEDAWQEVVMPAGLAISTLVPGHGDSIAAIDQRDRIWLGEHAPGGLLWIETGIELSEVSIGPIPERAGLVWMGDAPGRWLVAGDRIELDRWAKDRWQRLADVDIARSRIAVVPMLRDGRLAVIGPADEKATSQPILVEERSVWTGRPLYSGRAIAGGPVSTRDFRVLALAMLALSVTVLLFALRQPREADAVRLPPGVALAPPGVRLAATLVDWVLIATVFAAVMDTPLPSTLTAVGLVLDPTVRAAGGIGLLLGVIALAWLWGTAFEAAAGRTPGKWLVGIRVASVVTGPDVGGDHAARPGLGRSAARNLFKWALLPWAAAEASTPGARHRGDVVARAAVVVDLESDDIPDAAPGEDASERDPEDRGPSG